MLKGMMNRNHIHDNDNSNNKQTLTVKRMNVHHSGDHINNYCRVKIDISRGVRIHQDFQMIGPPRYSLTIAKCADILLLIPLEAMKKRKSSDYNNECSILLQAHHWRVDQTVGKHECIRGGAFILRSAAFLVITGTGCVCMAALWSTSRCPSTMVVDEKHIWTNG